MFFCLFDVCPASSFYAYSRFQFWFLTIVGMFTLSVSSSIGEDLIFNGLLLYHRHGGCNLPAPDSFVRYITSANLEVDRNNSDKLSENSPSALGENANLSTSQTAKNIRTNIDDMLKARHAHVPSLLASEAVGPPQISCHILKYFDISNFVRLTLLPSPAQTERDTSSEREV